MKKCELCKLPATLYCESDQASLCGACDLKVHNANFLVARHTRTLLCKTCQAPTPWTAVGTRLGNTLTECESCVRGDEDDEVCSGGVGDLDGSEEDCEEEEEEMSGSEDEEEDEEEGEHQVVPGSYLATPPPAASSSIGDDNFSSSSSSVCGRKSISSKRMREYGSDSQPQNDIVASSSRPTTASATSHRRRNSKDDDEDKSLKASKSQRIMEEFRSARSAKTQGVSKKQP